MLEKTRGLVLHSLKYGDSALIVDVYTETVGRLSFYVKIPRGRKAGVKSIFFQPLTFLELDYESRPRASFQKVRDVRIEYTYESLPYHPVKSALALFLSEFLYRALKNEQDNLPLFAYLHHSLQWLDRCSGPEIANFHLVFLIRLTRFLGFYPNAEDYHTNDYFDLQNAAFVGIRPYHAAFLPPEEAKHVPLLMRMNYPTLRYFRFSRTQRMRILEVINNYYRFHLPDFPELKSPEVLHELFS